MATQGVVSVRKGGKVVLKIVAGTNGMKAPVVAKKLREKKVVPTLEEAYDLAAESGLGCEACLAVMNETSELFKGDCDLSPLYRQKFSDAQFNPRWENGTADHVIVVDL